MEGESAYPHTCGELVQGLIQGTPLLVSCPVASFSRAHVRLGRRGSYRTISAYPKATLAVQSVLRRLHIEGAPYQLTLECPLPPARGFGTSTADICAAAQATARALGTTLSPAELTALALSIEPSDGTMWPGLVAFGHRGAGLIQELGKPPPLTLLILDPGGAVDTEAFHRTDRSRLLEALSPAAAWALELVCRGLRAGDAALLGRGATVSAVLQQSILPSPLLSAAQNLARRTGALGICRAHSGTLFGLIYPAEVDPEPLLGAAGALRPAVQVRLMRLIGGGEVAA